VQIEDSRIDLETSTNQNESFMDETTSPEELSGKAAEAKQSVSAAVEHAGQTAQAAWREAKSKISELQSLETYVREKPTQAVLVALGIGFIMGLLARR
jgi:ElaB/YqjD/DUF883 family membrane-anchored ribosome-binding protein